MYQRYQSKLNGHLELNWQAADSHHHLPKTLGEWILHPASFMNRLRQHGAISPRIKLLRQQWALPAASEKKALGLITREYALIREVLIYSDGKKWMYARTVFPRNTLTGKERCLARLKNRSLGSVLFKDKNIERSLFDVVCLTKDKVFHHYILEQAAIRADALWARRSTFILREKPLLLTEVFLPDMETL
ncbi:MAG TPA: chorismate lyase [Gammaproteobacteria bacterium]|nr:chorismate lyase [Gammaproteobacteria bacterium]